MEVSALDVDEEQLVAPPGIPWERLGEREQELLGFEWWSRSEKVLSLMIIDLLRNCLLYTSPSPRDS